MNRAKKRNEILLTKIRMRVHYLMPGATSPSKAEDLLALGIVKLEDEWTIRLMGSNARPGGVKPDDAPEYVETDEKALPFALVMQRKKPRDLEGSADLREPGETTWGRHRPPGEDPGSLVDLAK